MKQPVERRLAAILAADVAGYSRLMGADEEGTLDRLKAHRRELVDPKVKEYRGRIVKTTGDGMLVEFRSVVDAVRCAVEVQRAMVDRNADVPEGKRITLRIGINLGDVIADGDDIYGDGVNIAARLEALAEPGGICISRLVYDQIRDKLSYTFEDRGEQSVKNIARPIGAFMLGGGAIRSLAAVAAPARPKPASARQTRSRPTAPRLSIVVLPFANLSNDPEQEYFADGITDDLTTALSRISGSFVIARNTAFTYKGRPVDVKQIGRELRVRYVLEGSVRRTGDQVRVNVQLIDAVTGAHVWADRFDTERGSLVEAESEITGRLARTLGIELVRDAGRRIEAEATPDPDARDLVMRGWAAHFRPHSNETLLEARRDFERALELDPGSVDARVGIATILTRIIVEGLSSCPEQDGARAEQLLVEALAREPDRSTAHFAMGMLRRSQNRLTEARIEFETTISLNPNDARALDQLGIVFMYLGQPEAGVPLI
jgi:adenylate cyclase